MDGDVLQDESLQQPRRRGRKSRTQIDLNQIWRLYNDSVEVNGMSLSMLVKSKQNDREGGSTKETSTHWLKKIMNMYTRRSSLSFIDVDHVNIVCDASRHSVNDCLVSVFYSRSNNVAIYPPTQALRSAKFVAPGEVDCETAVERLLAEGSRVRLSGYRLLQAICHQLQLVTDSRITLSKCVVPEQQAFALLPVGCDETRVLTGFHVRHVKKNSQDGGPAVSLLDLATFPILVIGMDQGSCGMSCASFLSDHGVVMIHFYWDPYHRLIRDLRLALGACRSSAKQCLQRGQLCGSYIFSINYKPFSKAGFFDEKRSLLNAFLETEDEDRLLNNFLCCLFANIF